MTTHVDPPFLTERPFPGLRPFASDDHKFFFGREEQIYGLYRLIDHSRFVAVVGSSGSGKSSLVRAGLLPLLNEEGKESGGRHWRLEVMTPGDMPLSRLGQILAGLSKDDDPDIASARKERIDHRLRSSSFGMADALSEVNGFGGDTLLLVVDQFEELFRYGGGRPGLPRDPREEARQRDEATLFVQILLEVGRDPNSCVHVLLTMRSDFIGDCAHFQGLPEAVSACQFLVPSLARDQLEEVIVQPIKRVGARIEPALVQRLLNDVSDEPDQLPVLQHCLLRLWECAGADARPAAPQQPPLQELPPRSESMRPKSPRTLTHDHYVKVGRIAGALSQHADEILASLPVQQVVVEQVFRALAETDREGREIRRPLLFSQLLAETGVSEEELRLVLDRFRADDCSFLMPLASHVPTLMPDTRIDVGHEAMLRRWERVKRNAGGLGSAEGGASAGWLRAEEDDGHRYRSLLSMIDKDGRIGGTLPFELVPEWLKWWDSRPRTPAWGERYGGRFDSVRRLLAESVAARAAASDRARRSRWFARAAAAALGLVALVFVVLLCMLHEQRRNGERNFRLVVQSAETMLSKISDSYHHSNITLAGARDLLETEKSIVESVYKIKHTPETILAKAGLWLAISDLLDSLGEKAEAREYALEAGEMADELGAKEPDNERWKQLSYDSSMRLIGLTKSLNRGHTDWSEMLEQYQKIQFMAERWSETASGKDQWNFKLATLHNQMGDIYELLHDDRNMVDEYSAAVSIGEKLVTKNAKRPEWRRELASAHQRLGRALTRPKDCNSAMPHFRAALDIREALVRDSLDFTYISNLASSYSDMARCSERSGDADGAIANYREAIKRQEMLVQRDSTDPTWKGYLADEYSLIGGILSKQERYTEALDFFRKALTLRVILARIDPTQVRQFAVISAHVNIGDALWQKEKSGAIGEYRAALSDALSIIYKDLYSIANRLLVASPN